MHIKSAWLAGVRPLSASLCVPLVYPRLFALHHLLKDAANQVSVTSLHLALPLCTSYHLLLQRSAPLSASLCVPLVYPLLVALHPLLKDAANHVSISAPLSATLHLLSPLLPGTSLHCPPCSVCLSFTRASSPYSTSSRTQRIRWASLHRCPPLCTFCHLPLHHSASLCVPFTYPRLFALHHLLKDAANQSFESTQNSTYHTLPSALPLSSEKLESDGVYLEENGEEAVEQQKQQNGTEEGQEQHEHLPSARPLSSEKLEPDGVFLVENGEEAVVWEQQKQQNGTEEEQQHEHLPSALPLSSEKLEPDGVFLVENGEEAVVWVGREADSHLLFDLFGLRSVDEIAPGPFLLQEFDNPASRKLNAIVNEIRRQRCSYLRLRLLKRGDPSENLFFQTLVEDRSPSGMSYVEFLVYVHRQIQNKMG
ncbi:unnamed protein product [Closterium sp. NIES-65]|nr:unnamed protein product [Closterium sp. NIES-65]